MRIALQISPSKTNVPFSHLPVLVGTLHKWLGPNEEHDDISLYSFSWLQGSRPAPSRDGLRFANGAVWHISAMDTDFLKRSISGIMAQPDIRWGMRVEQVTIAPAPAFADGATVRFRTLSPILIKRDELRYPGQSDERHTKFYVFDDPQSDELLTETLRHKLRKAGLPDEGAYARFDRTYQGAKTKLVNYRQIENRGSLCPVLITGSSEQIAFAWTVGVGNSTGVGFGCLGEGCVVGEF